MKSSRARRGGRGKELPGLPVSRVGETRLVERILSRFARARGKGVVTGPGDDGAVIELVRGKRLVLTTDMLVEGTHFVLGWSSPYAVGFKAVTANLSDVAAMGARPLGIVVSLGIPSSLPVRAVDRIYSGISSALSLFGGELLGGDTVHSRAVTVCVSAVGELVGRAPLLRSGARPGHAVCVTGSLGSSCAGLMLLRKHFKAGRRSRSLALKSWSERDRRFFKEKLPASMRRDGHACVSKHLMPRPRVAEAEVLSLCGPSALIDISDGLLIDLGRVAAASGVGMLLREDDVPICRHCRSVAKKLRVSPYELAVSSGEEYELLFAMAPSRVRKTARALAERCGTTVTVIGDVVEPAQGMCVVDAEGRKSRLPEKGFQHF
ncbi:MAG: thiamine-phosphate kinase [Candidatus Eiseniibacteriota bacterium]|nr:MAG: thiamine-phosphate kinase [Candidatus Eisenbacteria bacterium]